jgi:hypothetical protein
MDSGTRRAASSLWPAVFVLVLVVVAAAAAYTRSSASRSGTAAAVQDLNRVESRLSQLEQRFYSVEASIRGLEQQSRLSGGAIGRAARDPEVGLLRAEVEALQRRLAQVECGLARVDERTLGAASREARRKSAAVAGDPCRLNVDAPLPPRTGP